MSENNNTTIKQFVTTIDFGTVITNITNKPILSLVGNDKGIERYSFWCYRIKEKEERKRKLKNLEYLKKELL